MIGLFLSEAVLFAVAALLGFAIGWRVFVWSDARRRRVEDQHISTLRAALSDAQVRRARAP
jgi:nicotinamidase-related amidase